MKTYAVKNLSCPSCAMKMEDSLRKLDSVREARIDFGAGRLNLDADDLGEALTAMRRIEPDVDIIESGAGPQGDNKRSLQLWFLAVSAVAFTLGMLIHTFTEWPEIIPVLLFLMAYAISGWKVGSPVTRSM